MPLSLNFYPPKTLAVTALITLSLALHSCADERDENPDVFSDTLTTSVEKTKDVSPLEGCYTMIQNKDTAHLILSVKDTLATGQLQYKRFEKDQNDGIVKGVISNGVLFADYIFQSEGVGSVREVAFAIKGDSLFEGYGEIKVNGNTAKFVDNRNLKFLTTAFIKVPCRDK